MFDFTIAAMAVGLITAGVTLSLIPFVLVYLEKWEVHEDSF
jgi:hypothetical protein